MLYYHCSGSLQLLTPPSTQSSSLPELIKLERSHESSLRTWSQDFLSANVAMNSWAISESADRPTLETLSQISKLLMKTDSAQNEYASALADYRACLRNALNKETELENLKKDRQVLLKRFLKLNRREPLTPLSNLNFRIKLDEAKRELFICQTTLRATADELYEMKQTCLRQALRDKLSKFEYFGQTIKQSAQQSIQLLDRIISNDLSEATESDFQSCDQVSIDEPTLLTPPPPNHDYNSWPARSHPKTQDGPNSINIQDFRRTPIVRSQVDYPLHRSPMLNHPTGLHVYSGSRHPYYSKQATMPGTALVPPPRVLVKKRGSLQSRQSRLRPQIRTKQTSLSSNPPRTRDAINSSRVGRTHYRQRSRSVAIQPTSSNMPRDPSKDGKLISIVPSSSSPSQISPKPSESRSLNRLASMNPPPMVNDSGSSFKFFSKGMISKLGGIRKVKDEKNPSVYEKRDQKGDDKTEDMTSVQVHPEPPFWPTIQPLSLNSDAYSDDSCNDQEEGVRRSQSDDDTGLEYSVRSSRTLRADTHSIGKGNTESSPERFNQSSHLIQSMARHSRNPSWKNIPKKSRRNSEARKVRRNRISRRARSTRSENFNSDSDDLFGQAISQHDTQESGSKNVPLSRIQEYDVSSTSLIGAKKAGSTLESATQHDQHNTSVKPPPSDSLIADEKHQVEKLNSASKSTSHQMKDKNYNGIFHHQPTLEDDDDDDEFKLQSNTQKAMGDIKARFFALGMQPSP